MKRRKFLAATALALLGEGVLAAPKSNSKPATSKPSSSKPSSKSSSKPTSSGKPKPGSKAAVAPPRSPLNSADHAVIDIPPPGTSATKLPPVKPPELPDVWQDFEITTQVALKASKGIQKLWLPLPLNLSTLYQRNLGYEWKGNAESVRLQRLPDGEQEVLCVTWAPGTEDGQLRLTQTVSLAERSFDVTRRSLAPEREDILRRYLRSTTLIPNEGDIYDLAMRIVGRIKDPVAQVKSLFEWISDNTAYLPDLPGGGTGDVVQQLRTGRYGGGSVDIAALFVGLCRSMGIPARQVFGLRVDRSLLSDSLSANPTDLRREQHCRAEFYVPGYSWIPVDPADACRAGASTNLSGRNLASLRRILFGTWETNWLAYGTASDVNLAGLRKPLPFLNQPVLLRAGEEQPTPLTQLPGTITQLRLTSQRVLSSY